MRANTTRTPIRWSHTLSGCLILGAMFGCASPEAMGGPDTPLTPGNHDLTLIVGERERSYLLHVPPGLKADEPVPTVILFHGAYGDGRAVQKMSKMDPIAERERFLAVYPNGIRRAWNAGDCCGFPQRHGIDDVAFISALIDELARKFTIDHKRVYAAGMSNGAMMVHLLGCKLSDRIAALGTVAGTIRLSTCRPKRPVPIIHFHGTADKRVPWHGGTGENIAAGTHSSVPNTIEGYARRSGCRSKPQQTLRKGNVTCESYAPCSSHGDVVLCTVTGGGHQWPGGEPFWERKLGPMTTDVSAAQMMWEFFEAHPMP